MSEIGSQWRDTRGEIWTQGEGGLMVTDDSPVFSRERVEEKWGPLERVWTLEEIESDQLQAHQDWLRYQPLVDPPDPKFLEHVAEDCLKCQALRRPKVWYRHARDCMHAPLNDLHDLQPKREGCTCWPQRVETR